MRDPKDRASLAAACADGDRIRFLYFWGHQAASDGSIDKSCLSQWWPSPFQVDGLQYQTAEHYMMAAKARLFDDEECATRIIACSHPGEAKKLGRRVRNFDDETWQAHRFEIVVHGNSAKFMQHDDLRSFLLGSGDRILVEASPVDPVWGIGLAQDHPDAAHPAKWPGLNLLGFALMEVRSRLATNKSPGMQ